MSKIPDDVSSDDLELLENMRKVWSKMQCRTIAEWLHLTSKQPELQRNVIPLLSRYHMIVFKAGKYADFTSQQV